MFARPSATPFRGTACCHTTPHAHPSTVNAVWRKSLSSKPRGAHHTCCLQQGSRTGRQSRSKQIGHCHADGIRSGCAGPSDDMPGLNTPRPYASCETKRRCWECAQARSARAVGSQSGGSAGGRGRIRRAAHARCLGGHEDMKCRCNCTNTCTTASNPPFPHLRAATSRDRLDRRTLLACSGTRTGRLAARAAHNCAWWQRQPQ